MEMIWLQADAQASIETLLKWESHYSAQDFLMLIEHGYKLEEQFRWRKKKI